MGHSAHGSEERTQTAEREPEPPSSQGKASHSETFNKALAVFSVTVKNFNVSV